MALRRGRMACDAPHRRATRSWPKTLGNRLYGSFSRTFGIRSGDRELARAHEPERRQLTVMFCDLVGSTAPPAKLDPEDMREVNRTYQNAVVGEIARFEGHIAKFMGDGVLAYFGWPRTHEDEADSRSGRPWPFVMRLAG